VKKTSLNNNHRITPHIPTVTIKPDAKGQNWITFVHLGRKYYNLTLWASSPLSQRKWLENIIKQQQVMKERSMIFDTVTLSDGFFTGPNKVNCAAPYSEYSYFLRNYISVLLQMAVDGLRMALTTGCTFPIFGKRKRIQSKSWPYWMSCKSIFWRITSSLLSFLVRFIGMSRLLFSNESCAPLERQVITFPLDALDPIDPMAGLKRAKRISSHTSFFKAGFCLGKVLVCIVKSSQLSSTFKTLEPIDQNIRGRSKPTFRKLLQGGNDTLKLFRVILVLLI